MITGREELRRVVRSAVQASPAADMNTRLTLKAVFGLGENPMDALLTSPPLLMEAARYGNKGLDAADPAARAEAVYKTLFLDRSPVSWHAQAALWSLRRLGLDAGSRDLAALRAALAARPAQARVLDALDMANLSTVSVMADLFDGEARPLCGFDERLRISLCLDALSSPEFGWPRLAEAGCRDYASARSLLVQTAERLEAGSFCVTRPLPGPMYEECVRPAARALCLPLILCADTDGAPPSASALAARFTREGFSFAPYASGAWTPEALPGLWAQARRVLAEALVSVYQPLLKTGWRLMAGEIAHDVERLLSNKGNHCSQIE